MKFVNKDNVTLFKCFSQEISFISTLKQNPIVCQFLEMKYSRSMHSEK